MQTLYFNPEQTKELLSLGGDAALVLMQHYVAIAHQAKPNMEDKVLATMLCKTSRAVEDTRLKLTKAGWFKRIKTTINNEPHIMYAVGKQAVSSYEHGRVAFLNTSTNETSEK